MRYAQTQIPAEAATPFLCPRLSAAASAGISWRHQQDFAEAVRHFIAVREYSPGNESSRLMHMALISLLAYAGLRTGEARALVWGDIGEGIVHVRHGLRDGKRVSTKTGKTRVVKLIEPVMEDLLAWKAACPTTAAGRPVFPNPEGTGFWSLTNYQNFDRRIFRPAVRAAGAPSANPYTLRHTYISLSIWSGLPPTAIAAQAGHGAALSLSTYAHAYESFDPDDRRPLTDRVREAREAAAVTTA